MWIRSQDKTILVESKVINVCSTRIYAFCIGGTPDWDGSFVVGDYATPERAIEVLDEIQGTLINSTNNCCNPNNETIVYQMPEA